MLSFTSKGKTYHFDAPVIMGIVNVTPDSFSDGGHFYQHDNAIQQIQRLIEEGADIIDIGAESTRPGALPISTAEQIERIGTLISDVKKQSDILISIDTSDADVMYYAASEGADIINDVRALQQPNALEAAASTNLAVVLMHMQGQPHTMQQNPYYQQVMLDIAGFLNQRIESCLTAGISADKIIVDPGFGFGKTVNQNLDLLLNLTPLAKQLNGDFPILAGLSRKSMVSKITANDNALTIDDRIAGSLGLALMSLQQGAKILRVHDVKQTRQICNMWQYINNYEQKK